MEFFHHDTLTPDLFKTTVSNGKLEVTFESEAFYDRSFLTKKDNTPPSSRVRTR